MKKALVVGSGSIRGAYDAAALTVLFDALGADYFDTVYATSVGVFQSTFGVAGQARVGEYIWSNCIHSAQLIKPWNPLLRRPILDLPYLINVFQRPNTYLDRMAVMRSRTKLLYTLTNETTGDPRYVVVNDENMFTTMKASSALLHAHPPVEFEGDKYVDGALSDPLPIQKAISDGHEEITVVYNKPKGFLVGDRYKKTATLMAIGQTPPIKKRLCDLPIQYERIETILQKDRRIRIIRPTTQLPLHAITDTNKQRMQATIAQGRNDALKKLAQWK